MKNQNKFSKTFFRIFSFCWLWKRCRDVSEAFKKYNMRKCKIVNLFTFSYINLRCEQWLVKIRVMKKGLKMDFKFASLGLCRILGMFLRCQTYLISVFKKKKKCIFKSATSFVGRETSVKLSMPAVSVRVDGKPLFLNAS